MDFWVVASGVGSYDPSTPLDTSNPMRRDTVTLMPYQWVQLRFVGSNPGVWLFHCHLDPHFEMGMALIFAVDTTNIPPPPSDVHLCGVNASEKSSLRMIYPG